MDENGSKMLKMYGNGWNGWKWLGWLETAMNGLKRLEMMDMDGNGRKQLDRHAKWHNHRNQRLCNNFRAWVNFKTKHKVFCHKFNLWSIF